MVVKTGIGTLLSNVQSIVEFIQEIQTNMSGFVQKQNASVNLKELEGYSASIVAKEYYKLFQQALNNRA
jgi:hypothetical protein